MEFVNVMRGFEAMLCLPPMTGNGKLTSYFNGDDWGMVSDCFNHISFFA